MTDQYFTLVFRGDICDFKEPLKTKTVFGVPVAAGVGDAFAIGEAIEQRIEALEAQLVSDIRAETEIERLETRIEALEAALREIVDYPNIGEICCAACSLIASAALAGHETRSGR